MKKGNISLPSSNWVALKKTFSRSSTKSTKSTKSPRKPTPQPVYKKRKRSASVSTVEGSRADGDELSAFPRGDTDTEPVAGPSTMTAPMAQQTVQLFGVRYAKESLRQMILGRVPFSDSQLQAGKYLALDCEMVGVGINGSESSLARVSLVNYHGAVIMDEFVRQRERVVDYRTFVSGIRESDLIKAKRFSEIQHRVAALLKDRILVGHAVHNDLKALLLSHPRQLIRDTQQCAGKAKLLNTKFPSLRKLVQLDFGLDIQSGEHSSVTDARATMALFRLHQKVWDRNWRPPQLQTLAQSAEVKSLKRKRSLEKSKPVSDGSAKKGKQKATESGSTAEGRKGISSGLSTVVKRASGKSVERVVHGHSGSKVAKTIKGATHGAKSKDKWWKTLKGNSSGSKGSVSPSRK